MRWLDLQSYMKQDSKLAVEIGLHKKAHALYNCIKTDLTSKSWFWKKLHRPESKIRINCVEKCSRGPREISIQTAFWEHFSPFFVILLLPLRGNTIISGFKMDLKFGFPVSKNIINVEIWPSNCILGAFSPLFVILLLQEIRHTNCILRLLTADFRDFVSAHAQKHH